MLCSKEDTICCPLSTLNECSAFLASVESSPSHDNRLENVSVHEKIRTHVNIMVCTVPITNIYRKIACSDH